MSVADPLAVLGTAEAIRARAATWGLRVEYTNVEPWSGPLADDPGPPFERTLEYGFAEEVRQHPDRDRIFAGYAEAYRHARDTGEIEELTLLVRARTTPVSTV